ncbi:MAG TPA: hypothetical protein VEN81_03390 [Planctomycetota bacterium]|nr:hypothetical protein [Planctomycetota bacterium]
MNKIKLNPFLIGMGVAGLALVVFFGAKVAPLWAGKAALQRKVRNLNQTLQKETSFPSDDDIKTSLDQREKTVKAYKDFGVFYTQSSEQLNRWFDDLKLAANAVPNRGNFMASYRQSKDKIESDLKAKEVKIGTGDESGKYTFGFNWEDPQPAQLEQIASVAPADEARVLKEIQKRFWARERVANTILAILKDGGKVGRVHDFRFFRKLHPIIQGAWDGYPSGENTVTYLGVGAQAGQAPLQFNEYELPQKLGRTLTFGFALELPYSQVPRVISEILNPAAERNPAARLLVNVVGTHVTIREQNEPTKTVTWTQGEEADKTAAYQKARDEVKPIDVMLTVTCQIIDFDPAELKKFDAPAPQP